MLDDLIVQPDDKTPIFQQLEYQLLRFIRAGRLQPGEELPSVRAMAAHLAVNPMTVSKTVNRLVDAGWLVRRRGRPTCVAEVPSEVSEQIDQQLEQELSLLITHCKQLALSKSALLNMIEEHWKKEP